MSTLEIPGKSVELDEAGYLTDPDQWSEEVARALAEREGIELGEQHMKVIRAIRDYYREHQVPPILTLVSKLCDVSYQELHDLFHKQPGKRAAKLAGLPKASGCT
jgi:dissimilatory sulfite reductase related protein